MPLKICCIVAMDSNRVIGSNGALPWHLPEDLKHFSAITRGHTVLMGRKTFESLPSKYRPLPERKNIVISSKSLADKDVEVWADPHSCISFFREAPGKLPSNQIWIIGGERIYQSTAELWDELHLTLVPGAHSGDTYFPAFEKNFKLESKVEGKTCSFLTYSKS